MTKEIILVEVVNGVDLSTDDCKAFTDPIKAENYFRYLIGKYQITDDEREIDVYFDMGFCDFDILGEEHSIITKTITFEED